MAITISSRGRALLGAVPIPAMAGSNILDPNPPFFPRGVDGNAHRGPYGKSLREPTGRLISYPDKTNFTATILNTALALTDNDLTAITGGYSLHDGNRGLTLGGAKVHRMRLSGQGKRGPVRWELDFRGFSVAAFSTAATLLADYPTMAWNVYHTVIPDFLSWELVWDFGLITNEEIGLAATQYGTEVNSSPPVVRGTFTFDSQHVGSLVEGTAFVIKLDMQTAAADVNFSCSYPIWVRPTDIELGQARSTLAVPVEFARTAAGVAPIVIS